MTDQSDFKKLLEGASPLPWPFADNRAERAEWDGDPSYVIELGDYSIDNTHYYPSAPSFADAALIVAAVNALPEHLALKARVEELESAIYSIYKETRANLKPGVIMDRIRMTCEAALSGGKP